MLKDGGTVSGRSTVASLHQFAIRRPRTVLVLACLGVAVLAPGVARLTLRTDGHALVPAHSAVVDYDREVRAEFHAEDVLVVLIRPSHPNGVFNAGTLRLIQGLTRAFQALPGVRPYSVSSLDTEYSHRVIPGTLTFRRLLDPLPETPEALATLRGDLQRIELYTGTLVSRDGNAASILVGVGLDTDRALRYQQLREAIAADGPHEDEISVIGAPVAEALLGSHILQDLGVPRALLGRHVFDDQEPPACAPAYSLEGLRRVIGRHVGLVPIAIGIMMLIFAICFRSLAAAALPLIEVAACLVFVFALMGWSGVPIYLTIAVMPVILTAVGVADEIHIFARYVQELRARPQLHHISALTVAMDEMCGPVIKTSVTTVVGFLSFALSDIGPVRAFGVFTAIGVLFCMLWSLTVIPASLALLNPRWFVRRTGAATAAPTRAMRLGGLLTRVMGRGRRTVLLLAAVVLIATPFGLARIAVQDSWVSGFAPESTFYRATQEFNEQFLGTHMLFIRVQTPARVLTGQVAPAALDHHQITLRAADIARPTELPGHVLSIRRQTVSEPVTRGRRRTQRATAWSTRIAGCSVDEDRLILTTEPRGGSPIIALRPEPNEVLGYEIRVAPLEIPAVVREVTDLEAFVAGQGRYTVGGALGTGAYLATANLMSHGLRDGYRVIPVEPDRVRWLWDRYAHIRGRERLEQIVTEDRGAALMTVFLKNANYVDVAALMDAISTYEHEHLTPQGITLGFAGDVAVSQALIQAIVRTQVGSLLGSLVGILIVTSLLTRSLRWGLCCVLPCVLAVAINFAVMGWSGIPLGVATSMFAGMTLGIGVDFSIHYVERFRLAMSRGLATAEAAAEAATYAGPAILIDALAIAVGFGVLVLSQVPANARLGALVVLSIVNCLGATLCLLPAIFQFWSPRLKA